MISPLRDDRPAARSRRPVLLAASAAAGVFLLAHAAPVLAATTGSRDSVERILRRAIRVERGINLRGEQFVLSFTPQGGSNPTTRHVVWRRDGRSLSINRPR